MEIIGKVKHILDLIQGETEAGAWSRREIVVTTTGDDACDICISFFGERLVRRLEGIHTGDLVQVFAKIRSRQGRTGDKWFTSVEGNGVNLLQRTTTGVQTEIPLEEPPADDLPY